MKKLCLLKDYFQNGARLKTLNGHSSKKPRFTRYCQKQLTNALFNQTNLNTNIKYNFNSRPFNK